MTVEQVGFLLFSLLHCDSLVFLITIIIQNLVGAKLAHLLLLPPPIKFISFIYLLEILGCNVCI